MKVKMRINRVQILSADVYNSAVSLWEEAGISNPARNDSFEVLQKTLEHGAILLMAEENNKAIGTLWITHDWRRAYIHHMEVKPGFIGKGVGTAMLKEALIITRELGLQAKLEVHQNNEIALGLYQKQGFEALDGYITMIRRKTD